MEHETKLTISSNLIQNLKKTKQNTTAFFRLELSCAFQRVASVTSHRGSRCAVKSVAAAMCGCHVVTITASSGVAAGTYSPPAFHLFRRPPSPTSWPPLVSGCPSLSQKGHRQPTAFRHGLAEQCPRKTPRCTALRGGHCQCGLPWCLHDRCFYSVLLKPLT